MKSQTTLPHFFRASVLLAGIAGAQMSAAQSAAPLPAGVEPSHNPVPGIYIRGETTGIMGLVKAQAEVYKITDTMCQARGQGGVRLLQGRLEDLSLPAINQTYFNGTRSASYNVAQFLEPNPDDKTGCSFRVVAETTRIFKVFNGTQTTVTTTNRHGTRTRTVPGDTRPPSIEQLASKPLTPPSGWTHGNSERIADVPCDHWILSANGTTFDLCVPEPGSVPPPLDRGALRGRVYKDDVVLSETVVKELTTASPIDEAVFNQAAYGARH